MAAPDLNAPFQTHACPAQLPLWDDGVDSAPQKIPFSHVIGAAAQNADVVMFGDTDHFDPRVRGFMANDENLAALKDSGFTHITAEVGQPMQHWVDKFNDGALTQKEFEDKIHMSLQVAQGNENGEWTRQLGKTAAFAKDNGMQLVFIDPKNGWSSCPADLKGEALEACELENYRDRYRDGALSQSLSSILDEKAGNKVFQIYGQAHYSVDNGSKEQIDGRVLKLDVYKNRAAYENDKHDALQTGSFAEKMGWGGVKPDLVYMIDTEDAYTTCSTPDNFRKALNAPDDAAVRMMPAPAAVPSPQLPQPTAPAP